MNQEDEFALVSRPANTVERLQPGAKRILSGMVTDALDLARRAASDEVEVEAFLERFL